MLAGIPNLPRARGCLVCNQHACTQPALGLRGPRPDELMFRFSPASPPACRGGGCFNVIFFFLTDEVEVLCFRLARARVVGGHAVEAGAGLLVGVAHGRGPEAGHGHAINMPLGFLRGAGLLVGVAHGRGRRYVRNMPFGCFVSHIFTSTHVLHHVTNMCFLCLFPFLCLCLFLLLVFVSVF